MVSSLTVAPFGVCYELPKSSSMNKILDLFLQLKAVFSIMTIVSMISTIIVTVLIAEI